MNNFVPLLITSGIVLIGLAIILRNRKYKDKPTNMNIERYYIDIHIPRETCTLLLMLIDHYIDEFKARDNYHIDLDRLKLLRGEIDKKLYKDSSKSQTN